MSTVANRTTSLRRSRVHLDFASPELLELHQLVHEVDDPPWDGYLGGPESLEDEGALLAAHMQHRPMGLVWSFFAACANRETRHARIQGYDASRPYYFAATRLAVLLVGEAVARGDSRRRFESTIQDLLRRHPDADVRDMAHALGGAS